MRITLCITLFLLVLNIQAAIFIQGELKSGEEVSGELIETYEDRWFYEEDSSDIKKYFLLFRVVDNQALFKFFLKEDLVKVISLKEGRSKYKKFLKDQGLFFKGGHPIENAHVLTGNEGHHKFEKMFGNFAWDLGVIDSEGKQHRGDGTKNSDYYIFGEEIHSPLSGIVVGKVDGQIDNAPDIFLASSLAGKINNYLTIKVSEYFYLSLVHFKKNSITVNIGDKVEVGQLLGEVGNSGVSYLPHLHYTLYAYIPEMDRFISVPGFFQ